MKSTKLEPWVEKVFGLTNKYLTLDEQRNNINLLLSQLQNDSTLFVYNKNGNHYDGINLDMSEIRLAPFKLMLENKLKEISEEMKTIREEFNAGV